VQHLVQLHALQQDGEVPVADVVADDEVGVEHVEPREEEGEQRALGCLQADRLAAVRSPRLVVLRLRTARFVVKRRTSLAPRSSKD
jgi:hypothetical protein